MVEKKPDNPEDEEPISLMGDDEPISLVETEGAGAGSVRAIGRAAVEAEKRHEFKRALNVTGQGATRCRIFHSKIAAGSLDYMEGQVNEWLDGENIEVKHVGHVIGTMEGKTPEPNVIVIIWY